jgi:hypothetical protein
VFVEVDAGEVLGAGLDLSDEVGDAVLLPNAFLVLHDREGGREGGREGERRERGERQGTTTWTRQAKDGAKPALGPHPNLR